MRTFLILFGLFVSLSAIPCGKPGEPSNCGNEKLELSERSHKEARKYSTKKKRELARHTDSALDAIVRWGVFNLAREGHPKEAETMLKEWESKFHGYLVIQMDWGQGDHKPLSEWIDSKYKVMEFLLGKELMHLTRLEDLQILNVCIPVVLFCEDLVDEFEYSNHFVRDPQYPRNGLAPVVTYWVSFFTCVGFTWGMAFPWCGPISTGAEYISLNWLAPKLNAPLWHLVCRKDDEYVWNTDVAY